MSAALPAFKSKLVVNTVVPLTDTGPYMSNLVAGVLVPIPTLPAAVIRTFSAPCVWK